MDRFLAQYMPPIASEHGADLDHINALVHWLMLILFVVWGAYFVFVLFRFRASRSPKANYGGAHSHASTWGEGAVLVAEIILLVAFSIPAWSRWTTKPAASKNPLELRIVAEQFAWNIQYPGADGVFGRTRSELVSATNPMGLDPDDPAGKDDIITLNQLHLQVDRPVIIHLTSKDVIHGLNLPVMRVKQDAIPGMEIPVQFTPNRTNFGPMGWEIACAQLCGLGHYRMRGQMTVHTKDDFVKWLKDNSPAAVAAAAAAPAPATPAPATPATGTTTETTAATSSGSS
jgi:cytochrome c oxidase subunit 2